MKLPRNRKAIVLSVILLVSGFSLAGCTTTPVADTTTPVADTTASSGAPTETGGPTDTADPTVAAKPWEECPGIVERLNAEEDVPVVYEQISAADFTVQEVGVDVLAGACVMSVTTGVDTVTWAILPGGDSLVETVKANLADAGFIAFPDMPELLGNSSTSQGLLVAAFENGAALNAYLVYPKAFAPIGEGIVFMGPWALT